MSLCSPVISTEAARSTEYTCLRRAYELHVASQASALFPQSEESKSNSKTADGTLGHGPFLSPDNIVPMVAAPAELMKHIVCIYWVVARMVTAVTVPC